MMKNIATSVILIGMPGAGKSTLGRRLAKVLNMPYVDTDDLIAQKCGVSLQEYLDANGYLALRDLEEKVLLENDFTNTVVATGGSVVYGAQGMEHLAMFGNIVYLRISQATMMQRISNASSRGLASEKGKSLGDLYQERSPLYEKYASIVVGLDGLGTKKSLDVLSARISP